MAKQETVLLRISGMTCEDCAAKIQGNLKNHAGIVNATVDFNSKLAEVVYNAEALSPDDICALPMFKGHYRADRVKAPQAQAKDAPPPLGRSGGDGKLDLIVLGGGSGAFAAAIKASEMGAKVAIVEEGTIGGTCLNRGCIPTKHLIRAAEIYHLAGHNPFPGVVTKQGKLNYTKLIEKKDSLIQWARKAKYWDILKHHRNITYINSKGVFLGPQKLKANGRELHAPKFIIATGASAFIPPIEGIEKVRYLTSTEILELQELPKSLVVLGANAVGLEFAQMFARLGSKVTVHEIVGKIAPAEEPEISDALEKYLKEEGIAICTCSKVVKVREERGKKVITAQMPHGKAKDFRADELLVATGRRPNTKGFGLEHIGVTIGPRGGIQVNDKMQTSVPHIYAIGDVVDCDCPAQFVYVAAMQGAIAAQTPWTAPPRAGWTTRPFPTPSSPSPRWPESA